MGLRGPTRLSRLRGLQGLRGLSRLRVQGLGMPFLHLVLCLFPVLP